MFVVLPLGLASCAEPIRIQSVERLNEVATTHTADKPEKAIVYRFGVSARGLSRLHHRDGRLELSIFRCPDLPRAFMPKVALEPASPGAEFVYLRALIPPRFVDTDNWHCAQFHGPLAAKSEVFRFQPQGSTRRTRDLTPSTVRLPPPPM